MNGLPVVALIRSCSLERRGEAVKAGADEVVRTTGAPEKIIVAVERLLGTRASRSK